jgi:ABC-type oligopeptide transport system ATPase subunit
MTTAYQSILQRVRAKHFAEAQSKNNAILAYDPEQKEAIQLALAGKSFCLIGAAGTGKTTTVQEIVRVLIASGRIPMVTEKSKSVAIGQYGVVGCAFTRRARNNLAKRMPDQMSCSTFHGLLEFEPEYFDVLDPNTGLMKTSMRFKPTRNELRPIPSELTVLILEESSMLSEELHATLLKAIAHKMQFIYLGDLNQLPPVFGDAILGYKLLELPVIELTKVHRQKDGEILDFAWQILAGESAQYTEPMFKNERLNVITFAPQAHVDIAVTQYGRLLQQFIHKGEVNPLGSDMILVPFNKGVGQTELNKYVADYYDQIYGRPLIHVIAGFNNYWYAVGDKILVDKQEAIIVSITTNSKYAGRLPSMPSAKISRWGTPRLANYEVLDSIDVDEGANADFDLEAHVDAILESSASDSEERMQVASHKIEYKFTDTVSVDPAQASLVMQTDGVLSTAGELNTVSLGYVCTVHKAQGLQGSHIVLMLHSSHSNMLFRELLYTAVTRAQHRLTIFTAKGLIEKAIRNPRIKGNSLAAKIEFFKGRDNERQT